MGILPVGLCQAIGHGQDAHATCATVNGQMRPALPPQLSDLHDPVFIVNEWDVNRMLTFGPTFQRFTFTVLMGRMQVDFSP